MLVAPTPVASIGAEDMAEAEADAMELNAPPGAHKPERPPLCGALTRTEWWESSAARMV